MLTYVGQTPAKQEVFDISMTCNEIMASLTESVPKKICLKKDFPHSGPYVQADKVQLHQIVSNLIINACEGIGDRDGEIRVSIGSMKAKDISTDHIFPLRWEPVQDDYICLEISDTGSGIESDVIDLIFDPFFSTKFTGRGLGLAVVTGFVHAHRGAVIVVSEPGRGSCFRVLWPALATETTGHKEEHVTDCRPSHNSGKVLVVEDEVMNWREGAR